ncbi:oxidoreductase [Aliikangiella marina]|uniref:Oxidoreductase n=1 Tax=Aliikangiella marina TaxID=1712262 RepID=A0A545TDE9_9GAMM|nr:aldo/keto reductase [Aliikangiella marina]TQV75196.1 oxidoreductase [Aliikangiella marina]
MKLSPLVAGMWRMVDWELSVSERINLIEGCIDLGITSFDHADIYGDYQCESLFGEALAKRPGLRDQIQLVSKCGIRLVSQNRPTHQMKTYDTSYQHIVGSVENSLKALNTEHLDAILIHRPDPLMNGEEVARAFSDLVASGKILTAGVSNFLPHQSAMLQSFCDFPLAINQIEISVLNTHSFYDGSLDYCQQHQMTPMAWSPLAGGLLFNSDSERALGVKEALTVVGTEVDATVDQVAFAWLLKHPAGIKPIIGSGNLQRIKAAQQALQLELTDLHWYQILKASAGKDVA